MYYDVGGLETLEIIKSKLPIEEYRGFLRGNVFKYLSRAGYKTEIPADDYWKALDYLTWLVETYW